MQQRKTSTLRSSFLSETQESVRSLKRNEKKSKLVASSFWFFFRLFFPFFSVILVLLLFFIPLAAKKDTSAFLFSGASLSLFLTLCVQLSYFHIRPWRKHPSPLIFYRSCSHALFSLLLMMNAYAPLDAHSNGCKLFSVLIQFSYFTGECWLLTISVDLILSLTNPFTSYKSNLRRYHIIVWTSGAVIAAVLLNGHCQDSFSGGICWIESSLECVIGFYLFWVIFFYALSICAVFFSAWRMSRGLESTYVTRKACVQDTFYIVASYLAYSVGIFILFIILTPKHNLEENSELPETSRNIIAYLISLRGCVDAVLWFMLHDFSSSGSASKSRSKSSSSLLFKLFSSPLLDPDEVNDTQASAEPDIEMQNDTNEGDFGIDVDLSPQLNMALRQEVVHFTTMGIIRSVEYNLDRSSEVSTESSPSEQDSSVRVFPLDEDTRHIFNDYEPETFRRLRVLNGIDEYWYKSQISQPAKERIAEGGSGAFLFFCGCGEFMVKTVERSEADCLLEILQKYEQHLKENADSLLVRFLGLHSLKMYNRVFSFVVMRNIFPPLATINQRYDIKGSWVNRNSAPAPPGKRVFCRHCGELFVSGSKSSCPDVVGEHEANFVLKDNDLTTKIRLKPDDAFSLIEVLNRDSDALCSMGITDYSLLVGVRNLQYEVEPGRIISRKRKSTIASFSDRSVSTNDVKSADDFHDSSFEGSVKATPLSLGRSLSNSEAVGRHALHKSTTKSVSISIPSPVTKPPLQKEQNSQMMDLTEEELTGGYLARSVIAPGVYYMGIVDILQKWTLQKRFERLYKVHVLGRSGAGISCMPPEPYKARFQQKVSQIIEHSIFIREVTGSWKGKRELSEPTALIDT